MDHCEGVEEGLLEAGVSNDPQRLGDRIRQSQGIDLRVGQDDGRIDHGRRSVGSASWLASRVLS